VNEIGNQPTYKRQRFLLAFVRQLDDIVTATDLQKLVFFHTMSGDSDYYEFIPYKFGPYSFQLSDDLEILRRDGFMVMGYEQNSANIKAAGVLPHSPKEVLFRIAPERGNALIRRAYREYPYYAINSQITGRFFSGEELEQFSNGEQSCTKIGQVLFTIGYEGKSIEAFINILIRNDVRLLCDVRKNPQSRKLGFSKRKLKHIAQTVGIKYIHTPELGVESDKRRLLETIEDYRCLFRDYKESLPGRTALLEEVYMLLCANNRVALMCYEREPEMCHRHIIRDYLVEKYRIRSVDV